VARLLFWILLAAVAYAALKGWSRTGGGRVGGRGPNRAPETIVRCAVCGLNVPQSEALACDGQWYCSREHLERARPGS
jgi:uncharacterized protein